MIHDTWVSGEGVGIYNRYSICIYTMLRHYTSVVS